VDLKGPVIVHLKRGTGTRPNKDYKAPTPGAPTKHVKLDHLIDEFPSHDRGKSDGVDRKLVEIHYEPHPKQDIFSQAIERGAKIIFFLAGIRSGKTFAGAYECLKQLYTYDRTPNLAYMVAPTNAMTRTPRRIFEMVAGDALVTSKRASDAGPAHFLMRPTRSIQKHYFIIEHHTAEHADRMRGPTIAFAWLDEVQLMKSEVIDVIRGRVMESGGIIFMTGTPAFPSHWTKTEVLDRAYRCGKCGTCVYDHYELAKGPDGEPERDKYGKETRRYIPMDHEPEQCYGDPRVAVITCSSFDNTFLSKSQIDELKADYAAKDPVIVRRELHAEYAGFEGLVYSHFDRKTHASEYTPATVPHDALVVAGLDFGLNDPFVCTFLARIGDAWHVVAEYYSQDKGKHLSEHVRGIQAAAGPLWKRVKNWWHDPSGRIIAMELSRYGLRPMKSARRRMSTGKNWLTYRIEVVTSHLMARDAQNKPLLRLSPKCPRTIIDFESRKWKRYTSKGEDGIARIIDLKGHEVDRNAGDEPAPGNDHGTDATEYALCSEFVKGLYKIKGSAQASASDGMIEERLKPLSPEEWSLGQHLASQLAGHQKEVLATKPERHAGRMFPGWLA